MLKDNKLFFTFLLVALGSWFFAIDSQAQTACAQTLRQARTVFDEGRIHELEKRLSDCIESGFNDEERTEAYRLLILSFIYLDETAKADAAMLALLKDNHGYAVNPDADPAELINLYNTFRHDPIFFWGFKVGPNTTFVNVQKAFGVHNVNGSSSSYSNKVGFEGALMAEKTFGRLTAHSDIGYYINSFDYNNTFFIAADGSALIDHLSTETQTSLGLSLMAQYRLFKVEEEQRKSKFEKWNPYVGLGATLRYLLGSELAADTKRTGGASADGANEDLIDLEFRRNLNPTIDLEIGFKRKIGLSYFLLSARYSYGLLNITDRNYDFGRLSTFYGWAANDINVHAFSISAGILIPKYSPKKLIK